MTPPASLAAVPASPAIASDWLDLVKARLTGFVLVSAMAGYLCASKGGQLLWTKALASVAGIALVACAAAALNEWLERHDDALMARTRDRPLPTGRMHPLTALLAGVALALAGMGILWLAAGRLPALLSFATLAIYLGLYTPLKKLSPWCVPIGAISGALPPLIGAVSATGRIEVAGVFLFLVLALWQFPHFLAIAWMYREDYAGAGFVVLPRGDISGRKTALIAGAGALLLLVVTAEVCYLGHASLWFLAAAIAAGILLLGAALEFLEERSRAKARRLFLTSIFYLPVVLVAAVLLR